MLALAPGFDVPEEWLARREAGEPLAWITGQVVFAGRRLAVDPGVYVPRTQSEDLARLAAGLLGPAGRALDLCTGAGAIADHLSAARPDALVVGVDIDLHAARCARSNGVRVVVGDLDGPIRGVGSFDLVTAIAPYVPAGEMRFLPSDVTSHEPVRALDGGADGLDVVRRVVAAAARLLRPGGHLLVEIGGGQDELIVPEMFRQGLDPVTIWYDEDGDLRGADAVRA